jgi:hypothetical protein
MSAYTVPKTATAFDFVECMGGRDRYIERMLCHRRKLGEVKANLKLQGPVAAFDGGHRRTPRPATPKSEAWKQAHGKEYAEVREARRRAERVKPAVDNKWKPGSTPAEAAHRISRNRRLAATEWFSQDAHETRRAHMMRRIASQDTMTERRKNPHDWRLHPPLRMRKSRSLAPDQLWKEEAEKRALYSPARPSSTRPSLSAATHRHSAGDLRRPASACADGRPPASSRPYISARPASARASSARPLGVTFDRASRAPPGGVQLDPHDDYLSLREALLQEIVRRRLYKEQELRRFLTQVTPLRQQGRCWQASGRGS